MEREHYRSYSRRTERRPQGDAVFSTLLAQITVCLVLLLLAFCLKISGLPVYQTVRTAAADGLSKEIEFPPLAAVLQRFQLQMPVMNPTTPEETTSDKSAIVSGEVEDIPTSDEASKMEEQSSTSADASMENVPNPNIDDEAAQTLAPEQQGVFDDELAGLVEEYLPESQAAQEGEAGIPYPQGIADSPLGQGGGITPVSFSPAFSDKKRLIAPAGTFLSPFFIPLQPVLPVKSGSLTSKFGFRTHPITGKPDFHTGVDIAAPKGTPVGAVLSGTVSEVGVSEFYGNYVVLRHGSNLETLYGHCNEILVPVGAVVRQYESIARVGSTGMSTGNHVHLEFIIGGQKGDPAWVYDEF